jgi:hypothetical protein
MSYPWEPTEERKPDPMAAQLRATQRRHGTAAVKAEILTLLGRYRATGLAPHRLARMLDVASVIAQWLAVKDIEDRERLVNLDRLARTARRLAEIQDQQALVAAQLAQPSGQRSIVALMAVQTKLREEESKFLEMLGRDRVVLDELDEGAKAFHQALHDYAVICETMMAAFGSGDAEAVDRWAADQAQDDLEAARRSRAEYLVNHPNEPEPPEVDPQDPFGWSPVGQRGRRIKARHWADGNTIGYTRPGDDAPIDFNGGHMPEDLTPVVEFLKVQPAVEAV